MAASSRSKSRSTTPSACRRCWDVRRARHLPLMAITLLTYRLAIGSSRLWHAWCGSDAGGRTSPLARLRAAASTARPCRSAPSSSSASARARSLSLAGVTASLLVIFAQLGIERAVYNRWSACTAQWRRPRCIVPYGFKSMQLHAEVPGRDDRRRRSQPLGCRRFALLVRRHVDGHVGMPTARRLAWYAVDWNAGDRRARPASENLTSCARPGASFRPRIAALLR